MDEGTGNDEARGSLYVTFSGVVLLGGLTSCEGSGMTTTTEP